jgi:glycosyltransferase involved in cell wall biosynthesis
VFTRRLAEALLVNGELDVDFVSGLARLPRKLVLQAVRARTGIYLADALRPDEAAALEAADPAAPVFYPANKGSLNGVFPREASTVHDVTTLFMPETHHPENVNLHLGHLAQELAADEVVFCISHATRAALLTAAPSAAAKTRVLPQYVDWPEEFPLADRNLPSPALPPYALVIGTLEPRKNIQLLLHALDRPEVVRSQLRFVVVGRVGWLIEEFLSRITHHQRQRVLFTGYVSEFVKYRLLRHCEFLVFPSLCEGFGIPALEAMSLGKAVLAARAGALPEVVGDAGVYFDPLSVTEFATAFAEIADARRRAELAPQILRRAAAFTPEGMAAPVIAWARS